MKNKTKYIISTIIFISTIFSSISLTNALNRGEIDKILNIKYGVEQIQYKLSKLPEKTFKNKDIQTKYNKMKKLNEILTKKFYKEYKNLNIDYYTTKGIIRNHQNFIYQTSKLFDYFELKIENPNYIDINKKIMNSYSEIRISYNRINFLFNRSKK